MGNIFTKVEHTKLGSNTFPLHHERKFTTRFGDITPILCLPTIPGDQIRLSVTQMLRFMPLIAPVMHKVNVYTHYFFVPNRIIWKHWEKFMTSPESDDVLPPEPVEMPRLQLISTEEIPVNNQFIVSMGDVGDYLGLPLSNQLPSGGVVDIQILPFLVYQRVCKDYFRDQNLQVPGENPNTEPDFWYNSSKWPIDYLATSVQKFSGLLQDITQTGIFRDFLMTKRQRAWQHDYFTSALPWAQKGDPVMIPLGTTAPLEFEPNNNPAIVRNPITGAPTDVTGELWGTNATGIMFQIDGATPEAKALDISGQHVVNLEEALAASVSDLRTAFSLEKFLERNARSGSRYFEWIQAHFGVKVGDGLLQRPEYLGGGANPVVISEVLQTSNALDEVTPQGNMAGHGISAGRGATFNYYCKEHGYILGVMTVMPKTAYQNGIPRDFTKFDQFDFFTAEFQNIGEQPIYNKELFVSGVPEEDDDVWGYIPRYSEYKYVPSTVHGALRETLAEWHMGRIFGALPPLNEDFIRMKAIEVSRIFAVTDEDLHHLIVYLHHNITARRKMQYFGSPGITRM